MISLSRSCLFLVKRNSSSLLLGRSSSSALHSSSFFCGKLDSDQGKNVCPKSASQSVPNKGAEYIVRNEKLHRPLSPHLTIYSFALPTLLSGTHRASGFLLGLGLGLTSLGILVAPHDFQYYVDALRHMHLNEYLLYTVKMGAAWLLSYHYLNGIRHLFWDAGKGFGLPALYKSGYAVLVLSVLSAAYLASL
ncbi:putative Succinate dehydrogenase cytochrome b560 subunit, mitochondrial [Hypsibius exemplaris]|uniref:Succinate dehydrogenase cytochrome b560 subunit, mitochondrial n=1 Tax=Hypsibius exemplaris TaxID=2072580 RepID=A0A1W0X186_HYPEX|nr:putative Succinate dehydrogenase cytochrome b560 subunit, mitochondrial [Hypsibius exemplaris]